MRNNYLVPLFIGMMMTLLPPVARAQVEVEYIDASGTKATCSTYTSVKLGMTTWNPGWYVVEEESVIINSLITVNGTVTLILKDGCTFTANSGINVTGGSYN